MNKQKLREIKLLELLKSRGRLDVATVTSKLAVSEATARRLFAELEKGGKLLRVHGGIQAAPELSNDYSFRLSAAQNTAAKEAHRQNRRDNGEKRLAFIHGCGYYGVENG